MSPLFIQNFHTSYPCHGCNKKKDALPGRSFCKAHLVQARLLWRVRSAEQRLAGKCFNCDKEATNGTGRCPEHREIYLKRTQEWMSRNGSRHNADNRQRELKLRELGLCRCTSRHPLVPGKTRCAECLMVPRLVKSKKPVAKRKLATIQGRRKQVRVNKMLQQAETARQELLRLGFKGSLPGSLLKVSSHGR